jgi:hypothetical protein
MSADYETPPKPTRGQALFMWHALIPGMCWNMMQNAVNAHPAMVMARWAMTGGWDPNPPAALTPAARTPGRYHADRQPSARQCTTW